MKIKYSNDNSVAKIYGNYSPWPITVSAELIELFNGDHESLFHQFHQLDRARMLPYRGSESHPLSVRAWSYAQENMQRGERYWKWGQRMSGNWQYTGYYYTENGFDVMPDHGEKFEAQP